MGNTAAMAFGTPPGYRENPVITDAEDGVDYWTPDRIETSARYQWGVYRKARQVADEIEARTIIDLGCGPGTKLEHFFPGFDATGLDQAGTVELCRRLGRSARYEAVDLADAEAAPGVGPADVVICADVLEHLQDPLPALRLIRSLCRPAGRVLLSTPERQRLLGDDAREPSIPAHVREWTASEFASLVGQHFEVVEQIVQLPFRLRADGMTARWLLHRFRARLPLRTSQVVVARPRGES